MAGVKRASEQPDLELVERIERDPAALDRALAALERVLDPLQGDQGVDAADHARPAGGAGRARRGFLVDREAGGGGAPRGRRGRRHRGRVRC